MFLVGIRSAEWGRVKQIACYKSRLHTLPGFPHWHCCRCSVPGLYYLPVAHLSFLLNLGTKITCDFAPLLNLTEYRFTIGNSRFGAFIWQTSHIRLAWPLSSQPPYSLSSKSDFWHGIFMHLSVFYCGLTPGTEMFQFQAWGWMNATRWR